MRAGRPRKADPGSLYAFAHQFYWDLRRLNDGYSRWRHDEEEFKRLASEIESQKIELNDVQNVAIVKSVIRDVQEGRIEESEEEERLRSAATTNRVVMREWLIQQAAEITRKQEQVHGRPDVIKSLLEARSAEVVRTICEDAFVLKTIDIEPGLSRQVMLPNWPIPAGSVLPSNLVTYASEFVAAMHNPRFPVSTTRPSSKLKQFWFLSRALAGALYGISVRTSVNLVGSKRPDEIFEESRAGKSIRRTTRRTRRIET